MWTCGLHSQILYTVDSDHHVFPFIQTEPICLFLHLCTQSPTYSSVLPSIHLSIEPIVRVQYVNLFKLSKAEDLTLSLCQILCISSWPSWISPPCYSQNFAFLEWEPMKHIIQKLLPRSHCLSHEGLLEIQMFASYPSLLSFRVCILNTILGRFVCTLKLRSISFWCLAVRSLLIKQKSGLGDRGPALRTVVAAPYDIIYLHSLCVAQIPNGPPWS